MKSGLFAAILLTLGASGAWADPNEFDLPGPGSSLAVDVQTDASSTDLYLKPTLPLRERIHAFGVVGYSWYDWNIRAEYLGEAPVYQDDAEELFYGLGVSYRLSPRWSLSGQWTNVDVSTTGLGLVTASLAYRFR